MANVKITDLPASAGLALTDILPTVDDPAGTPVTTKATFTQVNSVLDHDSLSGFVAAEHVNHSSISISAGGILSGGGTIDANRTITLASSGVDHDATTNFVANEHINHASVTLTAGAGLTGGGDITTNRSFAVDINGTTDLVAPATGDELLLNDISAPNAIRKADVASVVNLADHDALTNFVANEHIDHTAVSISSGGILSGGGTIDSNQTITLAHSDVDHDQTTNFVADEHVAHSGVTLTAGDGLSGGGTIAASRTFNVDIANTTDLASPATTDELLINDVSAPNAVRKADVASVVNLADHDALTNFVSAEHVNHSSVTLSAGAGIAAVGLGDISASRTIAVDGVLEDLDTLGAASSDGEFIVATGAGAFAYESGATVRASLGLTIGTNVQAWDADLDDLSTAWTAASATGPSSLVFSEDTDNGSNTITLQAPTSIASNRTITFPDAGGTVMTSLADDTSPQLGANLDVNGSSIVSASAGNIAITPDTTGDIILDGQKWPQADGLADQVLKTNGAGQLSWTTLASGGNVSNSGTPVNNQLAVWTGTTTIEGDAKLTWDGAGTLYVASTDVGATVLPIIDLHRDSASPAASDVIGGIHFYGEDSGSNKTAYCHFEADIEDPTDTTEDGRLKFYTTRAGSSAARLLIHSNVALGNANLDIDGKSIFLDADQDTHITADTDDQIDISIAGTDTYQLDTAMRLKNGATLYILETAVAAADTAAYGQFWVKNDTPNLPMFTDDAGNDRELADATVGQGQHTIWVPAAAMISRSTSGAAPGVVETTTNDVMLDTLNFDTAADEFAQFQIQMPKSWNESTLIAQFVWSHPTTTTNFGVSWWIQAVAFADGDAADTAFGTAVEAQDTGGTTDDIYISPETSAMTVAGSPAAEEYVVFQVYRDVSDAGDNLAVDARLHGVKLHYTTNAATDD